MSLYGSTKIASEALALEYGESFGIPVWVNRCGVLAGAGQFGTAEQGIFSFCVHAWRAKMIASLHRFWRKGLQVRDAFHPDDLADLVLKQIGNAETKPHRIVNVAGGVEHSMSLLELSERCTDRFGSREVISDNQAGRFDVPWMVLDSASCEQDLELETEAVASLDFD
jgi:CDP-paratose 2-epimerase